MTDGRTSWPKVALELVSMIATLLIAGVMAVLMMWARGIGRIGKALFQVLDGAKIIIVSPLTVAIQTVLLSSIVVQGTIAGESRWSIAGRVRARFLAWGMSPFSGEFPRSDGPEGGDR